MEVEKVLDDRVNNGNKEYKIKWKGIPEEEAEWETLDTLEKFMDVIKAYEEVKSSGDEEIPFSKSNDDSAEEEPKFVEKNETPKEKKGSQNVKSVVQSDSDSDFEEDNQEDNEPITDGKDEDFGPSKESSSSDSTMESAAESSDSGIEENDADDTGSISILGCYKKDGNIMFKVLKNKNGKKVDTSLKALRAKYPLELIKFFEDQYV
ncbi:hypothetical protein TVAG_404700 [Trichomonas vaginalis G3]|uniref:Chromo domain-containing protein n=1 Tax=Trichomonas vaginalis (strain ATCC PRA-98 / G3) TaxID=412133 RepID=A2E2Y8_TRIV3|nr:chromobox protein family [Trichomonas vaginalis G3]EAY12924.1 hypothetical protein TVAG_404700 [Trichomonas vaginalis G3]KAI5499728.1 chromobox protein family [Trichomonas vaginalis G3]|eukprot:XP_001325147.1 hypothetical protein [Trichomonas vaginalis G3]